MAAICYYVSGHGLGHASRAVQVMGLIPESIELFVRSHAPERFIRRETCRPLEFSSDRFDLGAWQESNVDVDWERTFHEAARIQQHCEVTAQKEMDFLRGAGVELVVTDVPAWPLHLAREIGIPGVCIANFTWADIYSCAPIQNSLSKQLVERYRRDYKCATLALRTPMSFPMDYFPEIIDIPLIARTGISCRERLIKEEAIPDAERLVLVYLGNWENTNMNLERLASIRGTAFVGFPTAPPPIHILDPEKWDFADVVASVDAIVAKPGYGTVGECMANARPIIYHPRPEFGEYQHLDKALQQWGGGLRLTNDEFMACQWEKALDTAFHMAPSAQEADGARAAADIILDLLD